MTILPTSNLTSDLSLPRTYFIEKLIKAYALTIIKYLLIDFKKAEFLLWNGCSTHFWQPNTNFIPDKNLDEIKILYKTLFERVTYRYKLAFMYYFIAFSKNPTDSKNPFSNPIKRAQSCFLIICYYIRNHRRAYAKELFLLFNHEKSWSSKIGILPNDANENQVSDKCNEISKKARKVLTQKISNIKIGILP